jgi:RNA polymerase sigma factor (sigma-70 family)
VEAWRAQLERGDYDAAWNLFIDRYRRLVLVTIRRTVDDDESVMDAFAEVCGRLAADGLARLKQYECRSPPRARFSTWLVAVVHNLTVDWLRRRRGRRRVTAPAELSELQELIFRYVFVEHRSHAEAYELVSAATPSGLTFGTFLKELAETYRIVEHAPRRSVMQYFPAPYALADATEPKGESRIIHEQMRDRLADALAALQPEERLGVQLYVVEELPAADVARAVGWPDAKAVYNRVYRALMRLREALERRGLGHP